MLRDPEWGRVVARLGKAWLLRWATVLAMVTLHSQILGLFA